MPLDCVGGLAKRGNDRRGAVDRQTAPEGQGEVVMDTVKQFMECRIALSALPTALPPMTDPQGLKMLLEDLLKRTEMGTKKYGTPLRVNNGRNGLLDLYQEIQDAIMYSMQCRMEGLEDGATYYDLLVLIGSQIAMKLDKQAQR